MKKLIFDLEGIDTPTSCSVNDSTQRYKKKLMNLNSASLKDKPTIIIDNGSYECRAGWSFENDPFLRFKNIVAKPKTNVNKQVDAMHLVGDEINEFDRGKVQTRSMFDKNVVYHTQSLEHVLDYTFGHLGLSNDTKIDYPLLMTEAMCNPNYTRGLINELLFECYEIPALSYGIDSLLSWHYNQSQTGIQAKPSKSSKSRLGRSQTGLLISSGHNTTHVVPIIDNQWQLPLTKRLNIGGSHHTELLTKSLGLKFPQHKAQLTTDAIQEIQEKHTICAKDYRTQILFLEAQYNLEKEVAFKAEKERREKLMRGPEADKDEQLAQKKEIPANATVYKNRAEFMIAKLENPEESKSADLDYEDHSIQLSWTPEVMPSNDEIKKRQEMRKEQGQKLKELMSRKRAEKRKALENELADLQSLQSLRQGQKDSSFEGSFKEEVQARGFSSLEAYVKKVKFLSVKLGIQPTQEEKEIEEKEREDKNQLLEIADEFLKPEQLKQKRIIKMHKTAAEMRDKRKTEQAEEKARVQNLKTKDSDNYLANLYEQRRMMLERMQQRAKQREEIQKRGSKSAQRRMRMIAELGTDSKNLPDPTEKQREDGNDDFGMEDGDWDVYRMIQKDGYSEDEENDQADLAEVEDQIADMDPKFSILLYSTNKMPTAEDYQVRLWTDRYRGSELVWQPSIIGSESESLSEILENTLNFFGRPFDQRTPAGQIDYRSQLMSNILLTGGNTLTPGFNGRVAQELRMINPTNTTINVVNALDCQLDAWRGAALLAQNYQKSHQLESYTISRHQYEEYGSHYLKEHFASNFLYGQRPSSIVCPKTKFISSSYSSYKRQKV